MSTEVNIELLSNYYCFFHLYRKTKLLTKMFTAKLKIKLFKTKTNTINK